MQWLSKILKFKLVDETYEGLRGWRRSKWVVVVYYEWSLLGLPEAFKVQGWLPHSRPPATEPAGRAYRAQTGPFQFCFNARELRRTKTD